MPKKNILLGGLTAAVVSTAQANAPQTNKVFEIGGVEIPRGTSVTVNIELPKMYNTPTTLPVRVIRGKKEGPVVFISAAIHGDELNGIEIIRRLRKLSILKGSKEH